MKRLAFGLGVSTTTMNVGAGNGLRSLSNGLNLRSPASDTALMQPPDDAWFPGCKRPVCHLASRLRPASTLRPMLTAEGRSRSFSQDRAVVDGRRSFAGSTATCPFGQVLSAPLYVARFSCAR
jgi:hypothetical protein